MPVEVKNTAGSAATIPPWTETREGNVVVCVCVGQHKCWVIGERNVYMCIYIYICVYVMCIVIYIYIHVSIYIY